MTKKNRFFLIFSVAIILLTLFSVSTFAYGTTRGDNDIKYVSYYSTPYIELFGDRSTQEWDIGKTVSVEQPTFFYSDVELGNTANTETTLHLIDTKTQFRIVGRSSWTNFGLTLRNELHSLDVNGMQLGNLGNYYQTIHFGSFVFSEDSISKSPYTVYVVENVSSNYFTAENLYQLFAIDVTYMLENNELVTKQFYHVERLSPTLTSTQNGNIIGYSLYAEYVSFLRDEVPLGSLVLDYKVTRDSVCDYSIGSSYQLVNGVETRSYRPVTDSRVYKLSADNFISLYQLSDDVSSGNNMSLQEGLVPFVNRVRDYWQKTIDYYTSNVGTILSSAWGSFANAELLPNVTLGGIFGTCIAIACAVALLKIFAF